MGLPPYAGAVSGNEYTIKKIMLPVPKELPAGVLSQFASEAGNANHTRHLVSFFCNN